MEKKILMVGVGSAGFTTMRKAAEIAKNQNIEVLLIDPEKVLEIGQPIQFKASPLIEIPHLFTPPLTRKERRKIERDKKKSKH